VPGPTPAFIFSRLVDLERQCCAFPTFRIVVAAEEPIFLTITGRPKAKAVTADFFGLCARPWLGVGA